MIVRPSAEGSSKFSVAFVNGQVIDTGKAHSHQAQLIKFPGFIAVKAMPGAGIVMPLKGEAHCDGAVLESRILRALNPAP